MTLLRPTLVAIAALGLLVGGSPARAHADTPRFPDLGGYTPANVADYEVDTTTPGIPSQAVFFLTPDGIICSVDPQGAGCTGNNFPAVPPVANSYDGRVVNAVGTDTGLNTTNAPIGTGGPHGTAHGNPVKTLPPLHSITVGGVVCGVDGSGTTACKDPQGRGFVLSPKGSGWLPHV
jgi:hypothetical protein